MLLQTLHTFYIPEADLEIRQTTA